MLGPECMSIDSEFRGVQDHLNNQTGPHFKKMREREGEREREIEEAI
jgi:hypothetical protein